MPTSLVMYNPDCAAVRKEVTYPSTSSALVSDSKTAGGKYVARKKGRIKCLLGGGIRRCVRRPLSYWL